LQAGVGRGLSLQATLILFSFLLLCAAFATESEDGIPVLTGRLVAVGIPEPGAISAVGNFHPGGPIHDNPAFQAFTQPGAILDGQRILVASRSNFGAAVARADEPLGAVLSIDPRGSKPIIVPDAFAAGGGQATALAGRVMLLTANSAPFLNKIYNPNAATADLPSVANPTGISLNNAFGRIWVTSMPAGPAGAGIHSVMDPDGRPLKNAPSKVAGGVFTGASGNREQQLIPGSMETGALATALLGKSPDGSGRAVFASLHADGRVVQLHVEQGVDGLSPAGTITPLTSDAGFMRAGMVFNWVPDAILYISDPGANAIVALTLRTNDKTYYVESSRRLKPAALDLPIDLAPAIAEVASPIFSSNTTLAGNADIYVANRGDGTIVRLKQDGKVVGVRKVQARGVPQLGPNQLNGIAVAPDAQHIWVTVSGPLGAYPAGGVIELPAFDSANDSKRE